MFSKNGLSLSTSDSFSPVMKLEEVDEFFSFSNVNVSEIVALWVHMNYFSLTRTILHWQFSCLEYVPKNEHGYDLLYTGSFCGRISAFQFAKRKVPRTLRPEDISRDQKHAGEVTCLMHR